MRTVTRLLSILLIAVGAGMLTYGAAVDPAKYVAPAGITILYSPTETVAWGVGMLVFGLLLLAAFGFKAPTLDKPGQP